MTREHQHKGKSSEQLINKDVVLSALAILPGQTILDAGCGNGYMAKAFASRLGSQGKVFAVDPDEKIIEILQAEIGTLPVSLPIEAIAADITRPMAIDVLSLDLIYLSTVLHGFSEDQVNGFQREVHRLLKPGGRLAIVEIKKEKTPFGPPMEMRFSPEELKDTIHLAPGPYVDAGRYLYMQIFEKG